MPPAIAWVDEVAPDEAIGICGAKMGRLAELLQAGVSLPKGFTVTVGAFRQHWDEAGLEEVADVAFGGLHAGAGPAEIEAAAAAVRAELAGRDLGADLAAQIGDAYEELSSRCFEINVPTAVRSSAIGEDSGTASFAGIFDTYLGVSGPDRVVDAVRACWASLFNTRAVAYRLRAGTHHRDMPMAVGVIELIHARASGVAFSAHPVTGKADRIVIETSWGWGEAVVQGLVTPDHVEVGKADGRVLKYQVADKTVVSAFDYAVGRVIETEMPARLVSRRVLDESRSRRSPTPCSPSSATTAIPWMWSGSSTGTAGRASRSASSKPARSPSPPPRPPPPTGTPPRWRLSMYSGHSPTLKGLLHACADRLLRAPGRPGGVRRP